MYFLSCISYAAQHVLKGKLRRNHFFFWHLTPDLMQDDAGQPAAETLAWRKTKSALCLMAWFCPANMFEECLTKMLHHAEANTFCNLILTLSVDWILMKGNQPREVWRRNPNKFPQSCFFFTLVPNVEASKPVAAFKCHQAELGSGALIQCCAFFSLQHDN